METHPASGGQRGIRVSWTVTYDEGTLKLQCIPVEKASPAEVADSVVDLWECQGWVPGLTGKGKRLWAKSELFAGLQAKNVIIQRMPDYYLTIYCSTTCSARTHISGHVIGVGGACGAGWVHT